VLLAAFLLLASVGVYSLVVCGLFVLGAHVSRCTGRVLQAIDLTAREKGKP
jgi:hypothetical protein